MEDTCIIVLVLAGVTLVANIAVCFYTLYLAKKCKDRYRNEGYIAALLDRNFNTNDGHTITFVKNKSNPNDSNPQETPAVSDN